MVAPSFGGLFSPFWWWTQHGIGSLCKLVVGTWVFNDVHAHFSPVTWGDHPSRPSERRVPGLAPRPWQRAGPRPVRTEDPEPIPNDLRKRSAGGGKRDMNKYAHMDTLIYLFI